MKRAVEVELDPSELDRDATVTLTVARLRYLMGREKTQGARRLLAQSLGFPNFAALKAFVDRHRETDQAVGPCAPDGGPGPTSSG